MYVVINVHGSKLLQGIVSFVSILDLSVYKQFSLAEEVMIPGLDSLVDVSWQLNKSLDLKVLRY